jgi:hypothetical protein
MRRLVWILPTLVLAPVWVQAQPPAPASGDALCGEPPPEPVAPDLSRPDAEGYHSLFNGVDFSGWWLNCRTGHSSSVSAIFRVDPEQKAIYSNARNLTNGGVLMTKATFLDYEIEFDFWPDWGNKAGLLHRTDTQGKAYMTMLNYSEGTSLGGVWGEGGFTFRDLRPFRFESSGAIRIPGGTSGPSWTTLTRELKARGESFDCPDSGCTESDWMRLWDRDGWNQIRVQFHGGKIGSEAIHARTWFRKSGAKAWVPLEVDTTLRQAVPAGYIGLLVQGGGDFTGLKGNWYRNIRWRPWNPEGSTGSVIPGPARHRPAVRVDATRQGVHLTFPEAAQNREIRVLSLDGKTLAVRRDTESEVFLNTAGWKPGVYVVRTEEDGRSEGSRVLLP